MKLCRTCRYGSEYELDKPCIVYREDCPLYEKEAKLRVWKADTIIFDEDVFKNFPEIAWITKGRTEK